jgi:hypothetical protein
MVTFVTTTPYFAISSPLRSMYTTPSVSARLSPRRVASLEAEDILYQRNRQINKLFPRYKAEEERQGAAKSWPTKEPKRTVQLM